MKLFVKVKPKVREEKVKQIDTMHFEVWVKEPPAEGKANAAVERALAKYFGVAPARVAVVSGHASRQKTVVIL